MTRILHLVDEDPGQRLSGYTIRSRYIFDAQLRLGLETPRELRRLVLGLPSILGLSFESNIAPKLDALQARLGLEEEELALLASKPPQVLGYSFERNVLPKLAYLQETFGLSDAELKQRVLALPALLGYSVERRYRPRAERCRLAGAPVTRVLETIALTDARFDAVVPLGGE